MLQFVPTLSSYAIYHRLTSLNAITSISEIVERLFINRLKRFLKDISSLPFISSNFSLVESQLTLCEYMIKVDGSFATLLIFPIFGNFTVLRKLQYVCKIHEHYHCWVNRSCETIKYDLFRINQRSCIICLPHQQTPLFAVQFESL